MPCAAQISIDQITQPNGPVRFRIVVTGCNHSRGSFLFDYSYTFSDGTSSPAVQGGGTWNGGANETTFFDTVNVAIPGNARLGPITNLRADNCICL